MLSPGEPPIIQLELQPELEAQLMQDARCHGLTIGHTMKLPYNPQNPTSPILTYEILPDHTSILLEYRHARFRYLYNSARPGPVHVAEMIRLARQGAGLSTYISQHVQENYAARFSL